MPEEDSVRWTIPTTRSTTYGTIQQMANYLNEGFWGGTGQRWNLGATGTAAKNGTLSVNMSGANNWQGTGVSDSNGITSARQDVARAAFDVFEQLLGIEFTYTTSNTADIFITDNDSGAYSGSWTFSGDPNIIDINQINVAANWNGSSSSIGGDYTFQTFVHEIGHTLGLGHQGNYNGTGDFNSEAIYANDSWDTSIMSYFSQWENPNTNATYSYIPTLMSADVVALNDLYSPYGYGTSNSFNGDTVYGFNTNISSTSSAIWNDFTNLVSNSSFTITDAGGNDTVDLSGFTSDQIINLQAPGLSDSQLIPSTVGDGAETQNLFFSPGTAVENAVGGSGDDVLTGNAADNTLVGNSGNDTLEGGAGDDTLNGGEGEDTAIFSGNLNHYSISASNSIYTFTDLREVSPDGITTISSIETVVFADQQAITSDLLGVPVDNDSDGLVDGSSVYQIYNSGSAITIKDNNGDTRSDSTSSHWDAVKAVVSASGFKVLLDGTSSKDGQFYFWNINSSGKITGGSGWRTEAQALAAGWESTFGDIIKIDGVIGNPITDSDSDGLVDGTSAYQIYNSGSAITIKDNNGDTRSDSTSSHWDAVKAVVSASGFKVLLDGTSSKDGQFYFWNINSSGKITGGSGWRTEAQALAADWESTFGDIIKIDGVIGNPITDSDSDGLVDGTSAYQIYNSGSAITIKDNNGDTRSDSTSSHWDAVKAVVSASGFKVLLDGASSKDGQFYFWNINSSGKITGGSGWRTEAQALAAGWESTFGDIIKIDGVIGNPITDSDSDGLVDGTSAYQIYNSGSAITIKDNNGDTRSDSTSSHWDAVKAVVSASGFKVLLDGASSKDGQFYFWNINSSGKITGGSGWRTEAQALAAGWESTFGDIIKIDGVIGNPITDSDSDGLVDGTSVYQIYNSGSAITIKDNNGDTRSDSTSSHWDAVKAVVSASGFKVLLDGTSSKDGQFYFWNINSSGKITGGSGWRTEAQALAAGWESTFGDIIKIDGVIGNPITDSDSDGLVDGTSAYQIYNSGSAITIKDNNGDTRSDSTSSHWDAVKAVVSASGFKVLLDGTSSKDGQFYFWNINSSGKITGGSGWRTEAQALAAGWESTFGDIIKIDGVIGNPITDSDSDGLVDGTSAYQIYNSGSAITIKDNNGDTRSDSTSSHWDAVKAVVSASGFKVLLDGASSKDGQFYFWNINSSGKITGGSGWRTEAQALAAGWESTFGDIIKIDGVIGNPITDSDSDGLVDGTSAYQIYNSGSAITIKDNNGDTRSDSTSSHWDAVKAVVSASGFKVLLDGASSKDGQFYFWNINSSGKITGGSGWRTEAQALAAGWESTFGDIIKIDGVIGNPTSLSNPTLEPRYSDQWHLKNLSSGGANVAAAWLLKNNSGSNIYGAGVHINIIDDGIETKP